MGLLATVILPGSDGGPGIGRLRVDVVAGKPAHEPISLPALKAGHRIVSALESAAGVLADRTANVVGVFGALASVLTTAIGGEADLLFRAKVAGPDGDDISIEYDDPQTELAALSVEVTVQAIVVHLATNAGDKATADIGAGANGTVTIEADAAGDAGNDLSVEVVVAGGINAALSAARLVNAITVTLGTDGAGAPDDAKNTATLVAGVITPLTGVSATASGSGVTPLTGVEGPTPFTGGGLNIAVTTTALQVKTAIEADEDASALVSVALAPGSAGTDPVEDLAATNLAAGSATGGFELDADTDGNSLLLLWMST